MYAFFLSYSPDADDQGFALVEYLNEVVVVSDAPPDLATGEKIVILRNKCKAKWTAVPILSTRHDTAA